MGMEALGERTRNVRWAVKGLIPEDSMGMIFGASGTYKSFIAIDLALHMAHEMDWAGARTKKGAVAYVAAEGGAGIYRRLKAWHDQFGLVPDDSINICITPLLLSAIDEVKAMRAAIDALHNKPKLIVIDTLSQTFSGDENSSTDIGDYLRMINTEIRAAFNCTVIVVHHTGHSAAERPRGSSAITANLDFILGVFRPDPEKQVARMSVHKMKDGDKIDDVFFEMERIVLGRDDDGDEISSLVAKHMEGVTSAAMATDRGRASKYEQVIMKLLIDGRAVSEQEMVASLPGENSSYTMRGIKRALQKMHMAKQVTTPGGNMWKLA
jgi:KaiC/GvpD/RAD55 family RecA-like ATPase